MADTLVHPLARQLRPAQEVLATLVRTVEPALAAAGDLELVGGWLERAVNDNGATRQRAAYERTGSVRGVVHDLITRTEASWQSHDSHAGSL